MVGCDLHHGDNGGVLGCFGGCEVWSGLDGEGLVVDAFRVWEKGGKPVMRAKFNNVYDARGGMELATSASCGLPKV